MATETHARAHLITAKALSSNKMKRDKSNENLSWKERQDELANENGLAIVLVDESSSELAASNNNSMCEVLYNSEEFAPKCAEFCGTAYQRATGTEKNLSYRCYAGLSCLAVPVGDSREAPAVAIIGRAFLNSEEYRKATERAQTGDWQKFSAEQLFENALLSGSPKYLKRLTKRLKNLSEEEKKLLADFLEKKRGPTAGETEPSEKVPVKPVLAEEERLLGDNWEAAKTREPVRLPVGPDQETEPLDLSDESDTEPPPVRGVSEPTGESGKKTGPDLTSMIEQFHSSTIQQEIITAPVSKKETREAEEIRSWRSFFGSMLELSYRKACVLILKFLRDRYQISSLAWAETVNERFRIVLASGELKTQLMHLSISPDDKRLIEAAERGVPFELRGRRNEVKKDAPIPVIRLFPISIGGEIRSALVLGDPLEDEVLLGQISRFCRKVAKELEILRLREELSRRGWVENAVRVFNENIKNIDSDDFWLSLTQVTAQLMNAERSSLLISDEKSNRLIVKAATGIRGDVLKSRKKNIGQRVAKEVFDAGRPLVIKDIDKSGVNFAPLTRKYKTNSFISYPITIGDRKLGVFNITDRADMGNYDEFDLELLRAIMPQLAVLIDRATLKHKAGEYEQLSLTDALTGLLNRRYLEERITEEIIRSTRHAYPMSFLMIDVDDFKAYNDDFTHLEGDKALRLVGKSIKDTLRGADVAARFGGEEFSILLPQTTSSEAQVIAERIRRKIEETEFPNRPVTVSIGVASCSSVINTAEGLIGAADTALYEAKRKGKNNVQVYENVKLKGAFGQKG